MDLELLLGCRSEVVGGIEPVSFIPISFLSLIVALASGAVMTLTVMQPGTVVVVLLGVGTVLTGV